MNCREFIDFLHDYVAGDLPPATLVLFHEHIGDCPNCVTYLHCYERTVKLCRGVYLDEPVPAEVPEELVQAILAARRTP